MALKITLKPHEKVIIGGAVVSNGDSKSDLIIENTVPLLREKDILSADDADTPCKRVYFVVQLMYVDEKNLTQHHDVYWRLVREIVDAAPGTIGIIDQMSGEILSGKYYQALKTAKKLIEYEQEVTQNVRSSIRSL